MASYLSRHASTRFGAYYIAVAGLIVSLLGLLASLWWLTGVLAFGALTALGTYDIVQRRQIVKVGTEGFVEAVVVFFILDQADPGELVELIHIHKSRPRLQTGEQVHQLPEGGGDAGVSQAEKKLYQHKRLSNQTIQLAHFAAMHKGKTLQQLDVLLVLEQRTVQRWDGLAVVAVFENLIGNIVRHQQLQPIDEL